MGRESVFERNTVKEYEKIFPGVVILKNYPGFLQGFPDRLLLFPNGRWAALEFKESTDAEHQPNQDYYIEYLNSMGGFGRFIYPENKEEVTRDLQQAYQS